MRLGFALAQAFPALNFRLASTLTMNVQLLAGLDFPQLGLHVEPSDGRLMFTAAALAEFCRANDLVADEVLADEDLSCWVICEWYCVPKS